MLRGGMVKPKLGAKVDIKAACKAQQRGASSIVRHANRWYSRPQGHLRPHCLLASCFAWKGMPLSRGLPQACLSAEGATSIVRHANGWYSRPQGHLRPLGLLTSCFAWILCSVGTTGIVRDGTEPYA
eukprot:1150400-Pelagomonas_calceolata.AAC.6